MWTSITKKEFIETLSNRETILAGHAPDYSDKRCVNAMKRITPKQAVERFKTVMEKSNDYILGLAEVIFKDDESDEYTLGTKNSNVTFSDVRGVEIIACGSSNT